TLTVSDQSPGNVGKINSWGLIVNAGNGASSASSVGTPNGTVFAADPLLMPTPRVIELVPTRSQQSTGHFGFESGWTQPTRQVPSMAQMSASARMSQTASERLAHAALAKLPAARVDLTPMLPRFSWAARLTNLLENS
ncbi:MAG TPA: hypothetical protein PKC45_01425, partial [Gemmatales bacterium]|nr:hypothetical protein [Gemmatales bacterium]